MLSRSLTWHLLTVAFAFIINCVKESFIIRKLLGFSQFLSRKAVESGVYAWLGKEVFTSEYYQSSAFYRMVEKIWQFILKVIRGLQFFTRKIFANSLSLWVFDFVNKKGLLSVDVFLALFVGMMFIVPHSLWNNLYAFLAAMFFAVWIVWNIASGKLKGRKVFGVGIGICIFAVAIVVSTITALAFSDAVRIALFMLASIILCYGVYAAVDTKEKLVRFLTIVLACVTITALFGVVQGIRGVEVDLEFVDVTANEGMPGRVYSTFANPNNFAELLVLFLPFFVPLFFSVKKNSTKLCVLLGFMAVLVALAMTYSRSCWVGFALCAVIFVCLYDKRLIIPMAFLVILAIPFLPQSIMNRIFTIGSMEDSSNSYRIYIWESCLNMIKDYGLTGVGLGPASFRMVYPGYSSPVAITAPHSHMLYMEIILELGILGAVGFFTFVFGVIKRAAGRMRIMSKELKSYAIAGISALGGIAFVCCAEYIWFYPRVMFAFWIIPGVLLATARIAKKSE
ncbi:MAG: O-antigen ligase family protein [Clostridia bacterium]|nr:O-antigen ligase family protein [Clostridia bacterium]